MDITTCAQKCKDASTSMAALPATIKNQALEHIKDVLLKNGNRIAKHNTADIQKAKKDQLDAPLIKRLKFDSDKIAESCDGIDSLIKLPDPVGVTLKATLLDKGLELYKVSRPIGVIGVIFESRPDALVQIAALCLKSGNAVLLKGGSEAAGTNRILADLIHDAGVRSGLPDGWLVLLERRDQVTRMLALNDFVDLIIPRGSNAFVKLIMDNTLIPVLGHADGICHIYVDSKAEADMALQICTDSKCQYVAVCNAAETFLIHEKVAANFLPQLKKQMDKHGVTIYGCKKTCAIISCDQATQAHWQTEYLDYKVSVKVVGSLKNAISHINRYGSGHTDVIVTADKQRAVQFMDHTDTANAFWNCSSRFADGFRFGLGAEVGISTNKIHARGPVGLEGLMIYQWRLIGNGHKVADYSGPCARAYLHTELNLSFKGDA
ncbi:MAG: glutamate-5-semialdehyde dehydrogenase [Desulfobacteraceae bacterium]|nr:glutamate-5-semialdehyde dehydrogenase [Desulfobacteraceae bacterium]